jgi:hypothetical protein
MTTDPIEVMANFIRDEGGFTSAPKPFAVKLSDHLTASGYVIMTTGERDGIRAAMAAEVAKALCLSVKDSQNYISLDHTVSFLSGVRHAQEQGIDAILALATAPAGFVCVPVEPTQKMISYGLSTLGSIWSWATAKHILAIYRAMTASHKEG